MDQPTVARKFWRFLNSPGLNPNLVYEEIADGVSPRRLIRKGDSDWPALTPDWVLPHEEPYWLGKPATRCTEEGNVLVPVDARIPAPPAPRYVPGANLPLDVKPEKSGGSVDYYQVPINNPTTEGRAAYTAECNDIIEALGMNYAEGNAFKAIWRSCAARTLGKLKDGGDSVYDAEKVVFFGNRMLTQRKSNANATR